MNQRSCLPPGANKDVAFLSHWLSLDETQQRPNSLWWRHAVSCPGSLATGRPTHPHPAGARTEVETDRQTFGEPAASDGTDPNTPTSASARTHACFFMCVRGFRSPLLHSRLRINIPVMLHCRERLVLPELPGKISRPTPQLHVIYPFG